jgi:hypothetical protein
MNDAEYAQRCALPDVMRRGDVRATQSRLRPAWPDLATRLEHVLAAAPVPKPARHTAGPESDFLPLDLSVVELETVADALFELEASLVEDEQAAPGAASTAAALHDLWRRAASARSDAAA